MIVIVVAFKRGIKMKNLICDGCGINNNDNTKVLLKSINSTRLLKGNETAILCNGCYKRGELK